MPKKTKLNLNELNVQSFTTSQTQNQKGGTGSFIICRSVNNSCAPCWENSDNSACLCGTTDWAGCQESQYATCPEKMK